MAKAKHTAERTALLSVGLIKKSILFVLVLFVALLLSIVVEWTGLAFGWWADGEYHSEKMVMSELHYLSASSATSPLIGDDTVLGDIALQAVDQLVEKTNLQAVLLLPFDAAYIGLVSAINIVKVFSLRLIVMILSIPTFVVFGIVGLARGLVARDLRKWGGGRESSGKYHLFLRLMPESFLGLWFIYLSMPVSVNPFLIVGPAAILFSILVANYFYRLKKYL